MIAITAPSPSPPATQEASSSPIRRIINAEEEAAIALSRNTSVISTRSSSSSSSSSIAPPPRPRPIRTYTGPQAKNVPDVLPASPTTPKATQRTFDDYLLAGATGATPPRNCTPTTDVIAANGGSIEAQMAHAIAMGAPGSAVGSTISSGFNTPTRISPTPGHLTPNGVRSRQPSGSNNAQNYRFEGVLGEGSYSTVRLVPAAISSRDLSAC
jgi:hypothetical protein